MRAKWHASKHPCEACLGLTMLFPPGDPHLNSMPLTYDLRYRLTSAARESLFPGAGKHSIVIPRLRVQGDFAAALMRLNGDHGTLVYFRRDAARWTVVCVPVQAMP